MPEKSVLMEVWQDEDGVVHVDLFGCSTVAGPGAYVCDNHGHAILGVELRSIRMRVDQATSRLVVEPYEERKGE